MAGHQHDWKLSLKSRIENQFEAVRIIGERQFFVHCDTGYNQRHFVDVLFSEPALTGAKAVASKISSTLQVTVEWMY